MYILLLIFFFFIEEDMSNWYALAASSEKPILELYKSNTYPFIFSSKIYSSIKRKSHV